MLLLIVFIVILFVSQSYGQSSQQVIGKVVNIYNSSEALDNNLIGAFSLNLLIGALLFGSIGFVAFIYGKRNTKFRPMIIGILLMGYPYFVRNIIVLYLVGSALTIALFVLRE